MDIDSFFGLPAHPLLVHIPIVLTPIALLGVVATIVRPGLSRHVEYAVASLLGLCAATAQLAAMSGRKLQQRLDPSKLIQRHRHLAEAARTWLLVFFALYLIYLAVRRRSRNRQASARAPVAVLILACMVVVAGLLTNVWIVRTGHAGAKAVWGGTPGAARVAP